jgi:biopolymer transport protein TolQ
MGLFAAIPAGIAFNRYADQVSRLEVRYDTFSEELSAIFQRNAARRDVAAESTSASGLRASPRPA